MIVTSCVGLDRLPGTCAEQDRSLHLVCMDLTHTAQIPHILRPSNSQSPPWSPIDESEQDSAYFPLPGEENLVTVSSHLGANDTQYAFRLWLLTCK